ncbi:MAG: molybdopterin cofactor-binding domain-containing protein [Thermomicrobiales bacterium]
MAVERTHMHGDESSSFNQPARTLSRRRLLQAIGATAGLMVTWSSTAAAAGGGRGGNRTLARTQGGGPEIPMDVDSYLMVNEDGSITVMTGKVEYGQGIQTGFGQLVAEELSVPFESVEVICGITNVVPYDGATVGSASTRRTGMRLRQAAAEMREWLIELGAEELGVPAGELAVQGGAVVVASTPATMIEYAALAAGNQAARELREDVPLKDPAEYTVVGQDIPRVDVPFKVNGEMKYGIDAAVEGMVYGKIVRPPARGATLESVDFSAAEAMPGVVGTFHDGNFAGLAAERLDQADSALSAVRATWTPPATTTTHVTIYDLLKSTPDAGEVLVDEDAGETAESIPDPAAALDGAAHRVAAAFRAPYVSHSPIEPKAALVQIADDQVDVWTSTQSPFGTREAVAEALGRPLEEVVVTTLMGGGAFGSKTPPDAEVEAARLAQAVGRPVKVIWTRQEEFQDARFRPAMLIELEAGIDADGNLSAWKYDLYSSAYYPEGAAEATRCAADQSANMRDIYDFGTAKTTWYQSHSPLPPHFWRVNGATNNTFAREVTLDELAELAGVDPVTFRTKLLGNNPRMQAVMDAVVAKAGWTPGVGSTGQGIGIALAFDTGSWVAEVAHVAVDETSGQIRVRHVDVGLDCGLVVNPLAVRSQAEGSVVMGVSPTLREMTTFENGRVTNPTFGQYRPLTMMEAPTVDVVFVEDKTNPMGGVGEPIVSPVTGAVANAIYDAVGIRLREVPFTPDRVLAALAEL